MAWIVDTCVLLDVRLDDPNFGRASAACLEAHSPDGLRLCPITFVEIAPSFRGDVTRQKLWLTELALDFHEPWTEQDTDEAHRLWNDFIQRRREGLVAKRPIADVLIAAFALRHQGLITRNPADFRSICPTLALIEP